MANSKTVRPAERRTKKGSKVDALMQQIAALSEAEREELVDRIEDTLPAGVEVDPAEIPAWHIEILKQRLANAKANPDARISLEEHLKVFEKYR